VPLVHLYMLWDNKMKKKIIKRIEKLDYLLSEADLFGLFLMGMFLAGMINFIGVEYLSFIISIILILITVMFMEIIKKDRKVLVKLIK